MQKVAIVIDNLVQFYSIKGDIDDLIAKNIQPEIYVFEEVNLHEKRLADETATVITNLGYIVHRAGKKQHYKVILEPYPKIEQYTTFQGVSFDYRLKYKYSLSSAKPNPVYSTEWNVPYDGILVYSLYEYDILRAFTETYLIKSQKYNPSLSVQFDKKSKKRLLYLPTFNDVNQEDYLAIEEAFKSLKKDWHLVIKVHHATEFRESEEKHNEFLRQIADEIYDHSTPINDVINSADVVLTGNSASVFEALYLGKPVAMFADSVTKKQLNGVNPLYVRLIQQGVIPYTQDPSQIPEIIKSTLAKKAQQKVAADEQFHSDEVVYTTLAEVVKEYLVRNTKDDEKHLLHELMVKRLDQLHSDRKILKQKRNSLIDKNTQLRERIDKDEIVLADMKAEQRKYKNKITGYEQSLSWRITRPLRIINKTMKVKR